MRKIFILLLGILGVYIAPVAAQNAVSSDISGVSDVLYSHEASVFTSQQLSLPIYLKNSEPLTLFQCDVELPEGFTFATKEGGKYDVILDATRFDAAGDDHTLTANLRSNGALRLLCASPGNLAISGNDGLVATVKINVSASVAGGKYAIQLNQQRLVRPDVTGSNVEHYQVAITVVDPETVNCDLNCDGSVDIQDVTFLVSRILVNQ